MATVEQKSLVPGYKHVEKFSDDVDYGEEEEQVTYVTLDLGTIEPTLVPSVSNFRIIGLDSPTPFLQLAGTVLKGRHEDLLGSELLFTDLNASGDSGWSFCVYLASSRGTYSGLDLPPTGSVSKRTLTHVANTSQRIAFSEVRLQHKQEPPTESNVEATTSTEGA